MLLDFWNPRRNTILPRVFADAVLSCISRAQWETSLLDPRKAAEERGIFAGFHSLAGGGSGRLAGMRVRVRWLWIFSFSQ